MQSEFQLRKMKISGNPELQYNLCGIDLNPLIGSEIEIEFLNKIYCINCGKLTKKSFSQGYCFPCCQKLACCDMCQVRPELCHHAKGTCRESAWGIENCFIPHIIYLASSSAVKIGITREYQKFTRWGDQGALQAKELFRVKDRLHAGLLEVELAKTMSDKTDWRALLTGKDQEFDLDLEAKKVRENFRTDLDLEEINESVHTFKYPIINYLTKAKSFNFEKEPKISGKLNGIRGQYLLIGEQAVQIRKYQGYLCRFNY